MVIPCYWNVFLFSVWVWVGYQHRSVAKVAEQISMVQERSMVSTILVAAIVSTPPEHRAEVVRELCPPSSDKKQDMCATFVDIFKTLPNNSK